MYRPTLSLATVSLLIHFTVLTAQEPPPIEVGQRVRVTAPDCGVRKQLTTSEAFRGDTLILDTTECPLASVTRLMEDLRSDLHSRSDFTSEDSPYATSPLCTNKLCDSYQRSLGGTGSS